MERFPGYERKEPSPVVEYKPKSAEEMVRQSLPADLAEQVIKSGRIEPCAYFSTDMMPYGSRMCSNEKTTECLTCPDYVTAEVLQAKETGNTKRKTRGKGTGEKESS